MGKAEPSLDDKLKKQNMASSKMDSTRDNTVYYLKHQCIDKIQQKCKKFFEDAKVFNKVDSMMKYLLSHPLLLAGFIIVVATLVIPIFLFTIFAIINVAIAFTSFIIIEGNHHKKI
ncbi:hypothetical protein TSAR_016948 [Trichomalopsis sarcophagae]|uniref:Uncharacterized protein n=1 Tax=Trichomalopsis sarcophagae TaxID=543379 RepID=A0A232EPF0_9HYME|nr:hypothetical protein TSAR_016948 [Trichomalopsis sarcophagae]